MKTEYKDHVKSEILRLLEGLQAKLKAAEGDEREPLEALDSRCKHLYFDAQAADNDAEFLKRLEILRDALTGAG
jgi:hypothetical protein